MSRIAISLPAMSALLLSALPALAQDRSVLVPVAPVAVGPAAIVRTPIAAAGIRVITPVSDLRVVETGGGTDLPRPSILLGRQVEERVFTAAFQPDEVQPEEIAWDNLAARRAMRDESADLYAGLVESGAFDPPEASLARALQTELARMNCYNGGIDGSWGNGSRASVVRYVEAGGAATPTGEATVALWRHLIVADDVTCPDVAVPVARVEPARTGGNRGSGVAQAGAQTRTRPPAQAVVQPAVPAAEPTRRGFGALGGGVIR